MPLTLYIGHAQTFEKVNLQLHPWSNPGDAVHFPSRGPCSIGTLGIHKACVGNWAKRAKNQHRILYKVASKTLCLLSNVTVRGGGIQL